MIVAAIDPPPRRTIGPQPKVDGQYTAVLLQNLMCWGWTDQQIADMMYVTASHVWRWRNRRFSKVELNTQDRVQAVYTHLIDQLGPSDAVAERARRLGYRPPFIGHRDGSIEDPTSLHDLVKIRRVLSGEHRAELTPTELACAIEHGLQHGMSPTQVQSRLHISATRFRKLTEGRPQ